jgi:TldD protein
MVRRHQAINTKDGAAEGLADTTEQGVGIRVIADGAWGFAATGSPRPEDVDAAAELAVRIARASATLSRQPVELAPQKPVKAEWASSYETDPFPVSLERKLGLLLEADKVMREVSGVRVATGELNLVREEKWYASSEGSEIAQTRIQSGGMIQRREEGEVQRRSCEFARW